MASCVSMRERENETNDIQVSNEISFGICAPIVSSFVNVVSACYRFHTHSIFAIFFLLRVCNAGKLIAAQLFAHLRRWLKKRMRKGDDAKWLCVSTMYIKFINEWLEFLSRHYREHSCAAYLRFFTFDIDKLLLVKCKTISDSNAENPQHSELNRCWFSASKKPPQPRNGSTG